MSATAIRAFIQAAGDYYLTPLSQVGEVASQMPAWIEAGVAKGEDLSKVLVCDEEETHEMARGYEVKRFCTHEEQTWEERVLIVRSFAFAEAQQHYLEKRLTKARAALVALTPPIGQGKRQIKDEETLVARAEAILEKHEVMGLLTYRYVRESRQEEKLVGSGRGGPNRPRQMIEHVRYQITEVQRNAVAIAKHVATLGWRAYGTNAPQTRLSFENAVLEYRNEFRIERVFGRFKGEQLAIAPLFVKRDDQVVGLTRLLSLAVRVLILMEFVVRRALAEQQRVLAGLYLDSSRKTTAKPTAERLLRVFSHIKLVTLSLPDKVVYQVTNFSPVHQEIIDVLGLPPDLYTSLNQTLSRVSQASMSA
ncbi:MAG: hypothetical protein AUG75_16130 [Cyanobacteria bacterium 13_1_20CM_4_61_6]|nr:MAG: hypothetical protein AUG75_16130 [Cyanobacteria bacterium 13_1_20CM_4_61_6]